MDAYTETDTAPPYSVVLFDGPSRYDATNATAVTISLWRDGALIVDHAPADHVGADGLVVLDDVAAVTAEPGPVVGKVYVTNVDGVQSFPPDGFFKTLVHPKAPPTP